jgi:predicted transcriptional regulator YdeE
MNPAIAKIGAYTTKYLVLSATLGPNKQPSKTYCVYTEYESDFKGEYTCFIGQEANSKGNIPTDFQTIPTQ